MFASLPVEATDNYEYVGDILALLFSNFPLRDRRHPAPHPTTTRRQ